MRLISSTPSSLCPNTDTQSGLQALCDIGQFQLTEANLLVAAAGSLVYSLFSLVEGTGMIFRVSWAGWMAIGESAFFIPIEIYEMMRPGKFSWFVAVVLGINIIIVCYLFKNRHRLFRHHHHHPVNENRIG